MRGGYVDHAAEAAEEIVIVVVEGPTAAGKTTWVGRHAGDIAVPERLPSPPPPADRAEAARFWAELGGDRWARALDMVRRTGLAVCDTDPLKLHYVWSLWWTGEASEDDFLLQAAAYRDVVASGRLGFADVVLVSIPDLATLAARRRADASRRRGRFAMHARLGEPLRAWYGVLERVRPGSVVWQFPDDGLARVRPGDRSRQDIADFDALVEGALELARLAH